MSATMAPPFSAPFTALRSSSKSLILLSRLLFPRNGEAEEIGAAGKETSILILATSELAASELATSEIKITEITRTEFEELVDLADKNHVLVRAFDVAVGILQEAQDEMRAEWFRAALATERARIENAKSYLYAICGTFE